MTLGDMAVVDGSRMAGGAQPVGVNARARVKQSVTARDRKRTREGASFGRFFRVVYLDAADSWIAEERSPSAKTVWRTDYIAHLEQVWKPYGVWARCYRVPAVVFALLCDIPKFLLVHPIRGPVTVTAAVLYLYATH